MLNKEMEKISSLTPWKLVFLLALLPNLALHVVNARGGQFYGASMSYTHEVPLANGSSLVVIELVTGWMLGQGPCGPTCSQSDVGRSTRSTRPAVESLHPHSLGNFTLEYKTYHGSTKSIVLSDLNTRMNNTYNETVISVNLAKRWEQEIMHFSVVMEKDEQEIVISFEGSSWKDLSYQSTGINLIWHLQTKIVSNIRSDTNSTNNSPRSISRPFYRVELGKVSSIQIPAVDPDGDFVKCDQAHYTEGGSISVHTPPNVQIFANCTVSINASKSAGYSDNSWIAVPVSVQDFNREDINYGNGIYHVGKNSLSTTPVQFTIQVVENLVSPSFVEPTLEYNHRFIIYLGSTWSTDIYAEASENATIDEFKVFGLQNEKIVMPKPIQQDFTRQQIKFTTIKWEPTSADIGGHVVCVRVTDDTGIDSEEDRCFSLEVRPFVFNYSSNYALGKPYFVDIPPTNRMVNCKIHSSCLIPLYVKSAAKIADIHVTEIFIDKYKVGKVQPTTYKGEQVYGTDLLFETSMLGNTKICLLAKDVNGVESEISCITVHIEPTDMCLTAPCRNSGTCVTDHDTGTFKCLCLPGSFGKTCSTRKGPCYPNPCYNGGICFSNGKCYCKPNFAGEKCEKDINDCHLNACNGHGICKDGINNYTCECFDRYSGGHCTNDNCHSEKIRSMSCTKAGCTSNSCSGRGVCSAGGHCTCPFGYYGQNCETPKCDITGSSTGIISPSAKDGSKLVCYSEGGMISSCSLRLYFTGKISSVPTIGIETSRALQNITTVEQAKKLSVVPGVSTIYSADIEINGNFSSTNFQYICLVASYTTSNTSVCYGVDIVPNPEDDHQSSAFARMNAKIQFVQPTLKDRSQVICNTWERCQVLLYTSFASNRTSCNGTSVVTPSSSVNGSCGIDDKDNDEHDKNAASKNASPCCENVISSSAEVKVFPAHPRGPSCVTEVSVVFDSVGDKELCFQSSSSSSESQQLCYTVFVYAHDKRDPCSSSPCQNNGHCFRTDQDNYKCVCLDNYEGDVCEEGPCQPANNKCQNDAFCQVNNGVNTCICKAGFLGPTCNEGPSSLRNPFATFSSEQLSFTCVLYQQCSFSVLLDGQPGRIPTVSPGYVDTALLIDNMTTFNRSTPGSFQTDVILKALGLGEKSVCIQTKNTYGENQDELCIKVQVVSDVFMLYSFKDRPHFVHPSLPANADVKCLSGVPCHVLYHVTAGIGNENECVTVQTHADADIVNYHLYSSCDNCVHGVSNKSSCSVDFSIISNIADNKTRTFCISVGLKSSSVEGESRCFNIHVEDANSVVKTGCQMLECKNGGFCDGHDPINPICFCSKGFSGRNCEKAKVDRQIPRNQTQSLVGDVAVPSEIKCIVRKACGIPFQIVSQTGIIPKVIVGYKNPNLNVGLPSVKAVGNSTTVYQGQVITIPDAVGHFKICLQVILNSKTDDEMCMNMTVLSAATENINTYFPYFLPPTLLSDAIVMCSTGKQCHFDMHFTSGDQFGYAGRCPKVTVTSSSLSNIAHVLDVKRQAGECNADVVYLTPFKVGLYQLCLQVSLPGKRGETRCYTIKIIRDVRDGVVSPCRGKSCANNGKCVVDFKLTPPKTSCDCKPGFSGPQCYTDQVTNSSENICFSCEDLLEPSFCDSIERCHSDQICYVESYSLGNGKKHYRSGCKNKQVCNQQSIAFSGTTSCLQCCEKSFCNSQGCDGTAIPPRLIRGPLCLDCARVRDPIECDRIAFCSSGESCSIEKLKWGDTHLYHLGCESTPQCSFEASSRAINEQSFEKRSVPVCHACCQDDFCNRNCTRQLTDNQQIIVG